MTKSVLRNVPGPLHFESDMLLIAISVTAKIEENSNMKSGTLDSILIKAWYYN